MAELALFISIIALICACGAYTKSRASTKDLKRKAEDLGLSARTLRSRTADMLETLEQKVRGEEQKSEIQPNNKGPALQNPKG